jgi:hypothetical protein
MNSLHARLLEDPAIRMAQQSDIDEGVIVKKAIAGEWAMTAEAPSKKAVLIYIAGIKFSGWIPKSAIFIDPSENLYLAEWIIAEKGL